MANKVTPTVVSVIPQGELGQRVVKIVEDGKHLRFYSPGEAADRIGCSPAMITRMMNMGSVRVIVSVDGRQRMLLEEDVELIAAERGKKK